MSNNHLTWLPESFATLNHIIHLDLSKNQLEFLPEYFGQLKQLRHLDLYSNQLTDVPVSFSQLKNLKWLDLKNNPLKENLAKAAGPCITQSDCAACAKRVVVLMQNIQSNQEKERQKQLINERKLAEERRLAEEAERVKIRAEKKAAKEKRRQEAHQREEAARKEAELAALNSIRHEMEQQPQGSRAGYTNKGRGGSANQGSKKASCLWTLWLCMLATIFLLLGFSVSLIWIYTGGQLDQRSIEKALPIIQKDVDFNLVKWSEKVNKWAGDIRPYTAKAQENAQWLWEDFKARNDVVAHKINTHLGPYFCSAKKAFFYYLKIAQVESEKAWIRMKPFLIELSATAWSYMKIAWTWIETNVPVYADIAYHKCIELAQFVQTTVNGLMKK